MFSKELKFLADFLSCSRLLDAELREDGVLACSDEFTSDVPDVDSFELSL